MANPHDTPNGSPVGGRVSDDPEAVRIYPLEPGSYCASGWHVISLNVWESAAIYENHKDLFADLASVDIQYEWDGIPLVEERTAIKRMNNFPNPEFADAFSFIAGAFMAPGSLTVGEHILTAAAIDPVYGDSTGSVEVTILPC